ncbi:hypothetical protein KU43_00435 [Mesotoga sp. SC_NapDC2]|nr:hypothetical protein EU77_11300 [Mesotoga sp. SC_NapDC]RIZ61803.1 hypothetical protein KU43_00435 [Mesotoga sp. SC_NapDC2]
MMNLHGICFLSLFFVVSKRVSLEAKLHLRLKASSRSIVLGSRTRSWPEACQLLLKKKRLSSRGASLDEPAPKCSCLGSPVQGSCMVVLFRVIPGSIRDMCFDLVKGLLTDSVVFDDIQPQAFHRSRIFQRSVVLQASAAGTGLAEGETGLRQQTGEPNHPTKSFQNGNI